MFYLIYKISSTVNDKIYIGSHKTKIINDGYMGSGKYLKHAYNKHGIENFVKEILFVFDNATDMYAKEAEIVNIEFLTDANTYNLKLGGFGGFDYINEQGINNKSNQCSVAGRASAAKGGGFKNCRHSQHTKTNMSKNRAGALNNRFNKPGTMLGKLHSATTKMQMKLKHSGTGIGNTNSQFGTMWITDGTSNKKIKKDAVIPAGWDKGRKLK